MTSECLKAIGKLPVESERLIILVERRYDILSEKNEQNVSAIEGDGMELGSGEGDLR